MHSYHPKTKKVDEVIHMSATKDETTICFTQPVKGMILGVKLDGNIQKFKNNLSQPKATLVMENVLLVADYNNFRVVGFDIKSTDYLG